MKLATLPDSLKGKSWTRSIWIDVAFNVPENAYALIIRGEDKVKSGAKPSTATDPADVKEHSPALHWTDESAEPRQFLVGTFGDDFAIAARVRDELIRFYTAIASLDACEPVDVAKTAAPILPALVALYQSGHIGAYAGSLAPIFTQADLWAQAIDDMSDDAKSILPILLCCFGTGQTAELRKPGRIGTYADWCAKREQREADERAAELERQRKAEERNAKRAEREAKALAKAAASLAKLAPTQFDALRAQLTAQGIDASIIDQISQIQSAVAAA